MFDESPLLFSSETLLQGEKAEAVLPEAPAWKWEACCQDFETELLNDEEARKYLERLDEGDLQSPYALFELSTAILKGLHRSAPENTAFVINSSTGKDSTLATHALIEAVRQEFQAGRPWKRQIVVAIADTGSEFPEMAKRMHAEAAALEKLGTQWGFPLTAHIVKPPPKHRLLVELCGNGKPLPPVNKKGKAEGVSSWCMDRVKAGTLNKIAREMTSSHGDYIAILGTRSAESTRRKESVARHSGGLPIGLSRITRGSTQWGLACTPITFWPNKGVSDFIRAFPPPWRPEGREEIRAIYHKGSPLENDENFSPSECSVTISEEGKVSNSCSDLSGTRYGCWHCFLSENKSLKNTAKREPAYLWPRKFHAYLRIKAKEAIARSSRLKSLGYVREESFSKTFTFLERYKLLMFLYRTQIESGFTFLEAEDEAAIATLWEKHGVISVTPADAKEDAIAWKRSGRWRAFFEDINDETHRLSNVLSEGIPFGALHALAGGPELVLEAGTKKSRERPLELTHLLAIAGQGFGSPPYPKILAYVYRESRHGRTPRIVTAITDTPSLLGLPTNTGLLNGMSGTLWEAIGIRLPMSWELNAARDRNFVYRVDPELPPEETSLKSCSPTERMEWAYQINVLSHGCKSDDVLKDAWFDSEMISSLKPVNKKTLADLLELCFELARSGDWLTDHFSKHRRECLQAIAPWKDKLLEDSPEGKEAVRNTRVTVSRLLRVADAKEELLNYARLMKIAAKAIHNDILNTSLILKLCYLAALEAVDPKEAETELKNLLRIWPHKSEEPLELAPQS